MVLGDTTRPGTYPKTLLGGDARYELLLSLNYKVDTKGEALAVEIANKTGDVCKADFRLKKMASGWPVVGSMVPGMSSKPYMVYAGQWQSNLSSACLEIAQVPGGTKADVVVFEPDDHKRSMIICTDQEYIHGLPCTKAIGFTVPAVKGVDDK